MLGENSPVQLPALTACLVLGRFTAFNSLPSFLTQGLLQPPGPERSTGKNDREAKPCLPIAKHAGGGPSLGPWPLLLPWLPHP